MRFLYGFLLIPMGIAIVFVLAYLIQTWPLSIEILALLLISLMCGVIAHIEGK